MTQEKSRINLILRFGLGLLIFIGIVVVLGKSGGVEQLLNIQWQKGFRVVLWTFALQTTASLRWHLLLRGFTEKGDFVTLLKFMVFGRAAGHSSSLIAGDLGSRYVYLKSMEIDMKRGTAAIFLDKLFEAILFFSVLVLFFGMVFSETIASRPFIPLLLASLLFLVAMIFLPFSLAFLGKIFKKREILIQMKGMVKGRVLPVFFLLTLAKYSISAARFASIMSLSGIDLSYIKVFMGTSLAQAGLILGFTPGGLGFLEAGWAGALHFFGVPAEETARFLVSQRLLIFASVLFLAFLFIVYDRLTKKYKLRNSNE